MINRKKIDKYIGESYVVLSTIFYASYGIWVKLIGNFMKGFTASAFRSFFVLTILLPLWFFGKYKEPIKLRQNYLYIILTFITAFFIWGPLYYAIQTIGVGFSLTVNYSVIVLATVILGVIFLKEKFSFKIIISVVLGVLGIVLLFQADKLNIKIFGIFSAVISGVAIACSTILLKKLTYNSVQKILFTWTANLISNIIAAILFENFHFKSEFRIEYLYLFIFAVASVTASNLFTMSLDHIDAGLASIIGLLEMVFALIFGIVFFNEKINLLSSLGIVLIIVACILPMFKKQEAIVDHKIGKID